MVQQFPSLHVVLGESLTLALFPPSGFFLFVPWRARKKHKKPHLLMRGEREEKENTRTKSLGETFLSRPD